MKICTRKILDKQMVALLWAMGRGFEVERALVHKM